MKINNRRVLVTGGGTFLGDQIATALIAEGAEVTLLVRAGNEDRIGALKDHVRWITADLWDTASLRGRARGHVCVVNTVGSMTANPVQGLTYHRLNFVSARNVTNMVISDGVPHAILMSSTRAPWMNNQYIKAKREAEEYVHRVGVNTTIIRAPITYLRGARRPFFFELMSLIGTPPPLGWTHLGRIAPMPVDVLARAVARLALKPDISKKRILYAPDLRRLNSRDEQRRGGLPVQERPRNKTDTQPRRPSGLRTFTPDDETPFGWLPPQKPDDR